MWLTMLKGEDRDVGIGVIIGDGSAGAPGD
jgi:hypothetical protein